MVDILGVRRSEKRVKSMGETLNDRVSVIPYTSDKNFGYFYF